MSSQAAQVAKTTYVEATDGEMIDALKMHYGTESIEDLFTKAFTSGIDPPKLRFDEPKYIKEGIDRYQAGNGLPCYVQKAFARLHETTH